MARANLRAAFMSGINSPVAAQQVFTDRIDEMEAFRRAVDDFERRRELAVVSPVIDRAEGRRNVLTFYGVGGIGKTTLSHELERRLVDRARDEQRSNLSTARIDLAEDGATDPESFLLRLRAALGQLGPDWRAFDLALASYWARAHPGESVQEFLDSSPMIRRAAAAVGLGDQIAAAMSLVSPVELGGLPGLATRTGLGVYKAIRDRVRQGRLMADCDLFRELVEADADVETLSYFAYLLAWDLDRQPGVEGRLPLVCVFVDTFEALSGRYDQTAERLVQRCMYLMPNVLFVVTGRNRVDWADSPRGELDFTGEHRWPNLHFSNRSEDPRQHLVGYLSDVDANRYLSAALTVDGRPAIPDDVRARIISGGQGLPLYLDLSVSHYVELLGRDRQPSAGDFGGSFSAVATRSIRDLPREERDLVRTAALLDRFDARLLGAGQPGLADGLVVRFLRRPFLMHDDSYLLPYALHLALRSAITDADETSIDGWSERDRREVAGRLLHGLGASLDPSADRSTLAATVQASLRLSHEYDVYDDWLVSAVQRLVMAGQWTALEGLLLDEHARRPELRALAAAIEGVLLRRSGDARAAVRVLEAGVPDGDPATEVGALVRLHLAHALRNLGDYKRASVLYGDLLDSAFSGVARYWLCDYDYLNGRFDRALADLGPERDDPSDEGERLRLTGHIWRVNARFDEAATAYESAVQLAQSEDLAVAEAKALVNLAQTRCWTASTDAVSDTAARARELLDLVPNPVELVKLSSAEAVVATLGGDDATARDALSRTRRLADELDYRGGHNLADVAEILLACRSGDRDRALETLGALTERTRGSGGNTYWVPVALCWIDGPEAAGRHASGIVWLDGPAATLRRWADVMDR